MKNHKKFSLILLLMFSLISCRNSQEFANPQTSIRQEQGVFGSEYDYKPNVLHYVIVQTLRDSIEKKREFINNLNLHHNFSEVRMNSIILVDENRVNVPILAIMKFNDLKKAKKYIKKITGSNSLAQREIFYAISQDNYRRLLSKRNLVEYAIFYKNNYP